MLFYTFLRRFQKLSLPNLNILRRSRKWYVASVKANRGKKSQKSTVQNVVVVTKIACVVLASWLPKQHAHVNAMGNARGLDTADIDCGLV